MRCLLGIFAVILCASPVAATIDPDPDQLGLYFDLNADQNCLTIGPSEPFFAYVTITNPSAAQVHGLEFSYRLSVPEESVGLIFRLANAMPPGLCDLGQSTDVMEGEYVLGLAAPIPGDGANVVMITWQYMLLELITVDFYFGPASVQSLPDGLPAYEIGGTVLPLGLASGDVNLPVASVNGDCRAVRTETSTFGRVKSLYR